MTRYDPQTALEWMQEYSGIPFDCTNLDEIDFAAFTGDGAFAGLPLCEKTKNLLQWTIPTDLDEMLDLCGQDADSKQSIKRMLLVARMIWYRVFCPDAYFAAVMSETPVGFLTGDDLTKGEEYLTRLCRIIPTWQTWTPDEDGGNADLQLAEIALACVESGIEILLPDLNLSHPTCFVPESGRTGKAIRCPLNRLDGPRLPEAAPDLILAERTKRLFVSREDAVTRLALPQMARIKMELGGRPCPFEEKGERCMEAFAERLVGKLPLIGEPRPWEIRYAIGSPHKPREEIHAGGFYVLGHTPSADETAQKIEIGLALRAARHGVPAYLFSMDQTADGVFDRILAELLGVPVEDVPSQFFCDDPETKRLLEAADTLPVFYCDSACTLQEIVNIIKQEIPWGIVFIDGLQDIESDECPPCDRRKTEIVHALQATAEQTGVAILSLLRVWRSQRYRTRKSITPNDLHYGLPLTPFATNVFAVNKLRKR